MHFPIIYFLSIISITLFTLFIIQKYFNKKEKFQPNYLLKYKKHKNLRILEQDKEGNNLDSNNFLNYYNLSIDDSLFDFPPKRTSNMTVKEYCSLLQKQHFLSNLIDFTMAGLMIYIPKINNFTENYLDFIKMKDFYFNITTISDKSFKTFFFVKGKNLTSNEDILAFADSDIESSILLSKDIILFSSIDDLDIKSDFNNDIIKVKLNSKLLLTKLENKTLCPATIELFFPMSKLSLGIRIDNESCNIDFPLINASGYFFVPNYDLFINSPCLESGIILTSINALIANLFNNYTSNYKYILFSGVLKKSNIYNVSLIFFSIINIIYTLKFISSIKKNKLLAFSIPIEFYTINGIIHLIHYFYSYFMTSNIFEIKASWKIKLINCLGTGFVLINYAFEILILMFNTFI